MMDQYLINLNETPNKNESSGTVSTLNIERNVLSNKKLRKSVLREERPLCVNCSNKLGSDFFFFAFGLGGHISQLLGGF